MGRMDRLRLTVDGRAAALLAVLGAAGAALALILRPADGRAAAGQD